MDDARHAEPATSDDVLRQATTSDDLSQPAALDTGITELLKSENQFLREQVTVKDVQIKDLAAC